MKHFPKEIHSQHEDTAINLKFTLTRKIQGNITFSSRVVTDWNDLPENAVTVPSINTFKNRLDNVMEKKLYTVHSENTWLSDIEGVT